MIELHGRQIERALIVDDQQDAREAYQFIVEDMDLQPYPVPGPLDDLPAFIRSIQPNDVVLCDFHLKKRTYAHWDGDRLVAECFKAGVPGVLCTTIANAPIGRDHLRYIPSLLDAGAPEPQQLYQAWEKCVRELDGRFEPNRRPWRTLVRIADLDPEHRRVYVVLPAWNAYQKVRLEMDDLPSEIQELVELDRRFHAQVNTGANDHHQLFFDGWETK